MKRRSARAFSLIEVLVASAVAAVFSFTVLQSLVSVTSLSSDITRESRMESDARQLLDVATRSLRNARPHGTCDDTAQMSLSTCPRPIDSTTPAFLVASADRAVFFAYTADSSGNTSTLTAPDLVEIRQKVGNSNNPSAPVDSEFARAGYALCVRVVRPATGQDFVSAWRGFDSATGPVIASVASEAAFTQNYFANSTYTHKPEVCVGALEPSTTAAPLLTYYTSSFTQLTASNSLDDIALVKLSALLQFTQTAGRVRSIKYKTFEQLVSINSSVLGRLR